MAVATRGGSGVNKATKDLAARRPPKISNLVICGFLRIVFSVFLQHGVVWTRVLRIVGGFADSQKGTHIWVYDVTVKGKGHPCTGTEVR